MAGTVLQRCRHAWIAAAEAVVSWSPSAAREPPAGLPSPAARALYGHVMPLSILSMAF